MKKDLDKQIDIVIDECLSKIRESKLDEEKEILLEVPKDRKDKKKK
jgi:hypothetical protein